MIGRVPPRLHARRPAASAGYGEGGERVTKRDYYEILGIDARRRTSRSRVRIASWRCSITPIAIPGDAEAEEKFKEAAEAYAVLADRDKRVALRSLRARGRQRRRRGGRRLRSDRLRRLRRHLLRLLGDIFGFGDIFGARRRRGGPQRGSDLRYDLEISFEESFDGAETSIQIPREETCETCNGSGAAAGQPSGNLHAPAAGPASFAISRDFFTVARPCSNCRGTGQVISKPCPIMSWRGTHRSGAEDHGEDSCGIATGQRLRLLRRGRSTARPAALPAISTSSFTSRNIRSSIARETISIASSPSPIPCSRLAVICACPR